MNLISEIVAALIKLSNQNNVKMCIFFYYTAPRAVQ